MIAWGNNTKGQTTIPVALDLEMPIVDYGSGDFTLDHTPHEHVALDEFGKGVNTLITALPLLAQRFTP